MAGFLYHQFMLNGARQPPTPCYCSPQVIITPMAPPASLTDATWFQGIQVTLLDGAAAVVSTCSNAASIMYMPQDQISLTCDPTTATVWAVQMERIPGANGIPATGGIGVAELSVIVDGKDKLVVPSGTRASDGAASHSRAATLRKVPPPGKPSFQVCIPGPPYVTCLRICLPRCSMP